MKKNTFFEKASMTLTFCVFVCSLIAPMYFIVGGNSISNIAFGRIPGIDLKFAAFDRLAIVTFFVLLILFFLAHFFYEKKTVRRVLSLASCVYSTLYLVVIAIVGMNGLVVFNFPIISIPLGAVLSSKFFILLPAAYFFMLFSDKEVSSYVRGSALFHAVCLVLFAVIKVFELIFPVNLRMVVFDISTTLYLVSLAMVTFFMYRKYYTDNFLQ